MDTPDVTFASPGTAIERGIPVDGEPPYVKVKELVIESHEVTFCCRAVPTSGRVRDTEEV